MCTCNPLGVAVIDLGKVDFSAIDSQAIDGLYEKCATAVNSGKPVILVGDWSDFVTNGTCNTPFNSVIAHINTTDTFLVSLPFNHSMEVDNNDVILFD